MSTVISVVVGFLLFFAVIPSIMEKLEPGSRREYFDGLWVFAVLVVGLSGGLLSPGRVYRAMLIGTICYLCLALVCYRYGRRHPKDPYQDSSSGTP